jgi:hypothetical protein
MSPPPQSPPSRSSQPRLTPPQIDFTAVGASTNLKPPAARMRYTRLRRQIESGTLIGTHGTPFPSDKVVEKNAEAGRKRKRLSPSKGTGGDADEEGQNKPASKKGTQRKSVVKKEGSSSDGFESSGDSESDFGDSEDEMPLAKLMKSRGKAPDTLPSQTAEHGNSADGAEAPRSWA